MRRVNENLTDSDTYKSLTDKGDYKATFAPISNNLGDNEITSPITSPEIEALVNAADDYKLIFEGVNLNPLEAEVVTERPGGKFYDSVIATYTDYSTSPPVKKSFGLPPLEYYVLAYGSEHDTLGPRIYNWHVARLCEGQCVDEWYTEEGILLDSVLAWQDMPPDPRVDSKDCIFPDRNSLPKK